MTLTRMRNRQNNEIGVVVVVCVKHVFILFSIAIYEEKIKMNTKA